MLCAYRAAQLECQLVDGLSHLEKARHILGTLEIEERPRMHLAGAGMYQERGDHFVTFEQFLHFMQEMSQLLARHSNVFDERNRRRTAAQAVQARQDRFAKPPESVDL